MFSRILLVLLILCSGTIIARDRAEIIVAQDGTGVFKSIQDAVNSIPKNNSHNIG